MVQETIRRARCTKGIDVVSMDVALHRGRTSSARLQGRHGGTRRLHPRVPDPGCNYRSLISLFARRPAGKALDPSNLRDTVAVAPGVSRTCLEAGATPLLIHHFKKVKAESHELPELEELAYAGIQEFARQWLLLKRRERPSRGRASTCFWLSIGGSRDTSGAWAFDIDGRDDGHVRRAGAGRGTSRSSSSPRSERCRPNNPRWRRSRRRPRRFGHVGRGEDPQAVRRRREGRLPP